SNSINGLLQTPEHARAVIGAAQPPYSPDDVERMVAARIARRTVFERDPAPALSFVLEEGVMRRPIGGTMVWRQQLERLLEVGRLRNVVLQVMPTNCETHSGTDGTIELLKFVDGTAVGRADGEFNGRPTSDPKQLRILELQYGTIRAQALSPRESLAFIEQLLGETCSARPLPVTPPSWRGSRAATAAATTASPVSSLLSPRAPFTSVTPRTQKAPASPSPRARGRLSFRTRPKPDRATWSACLLQKQADQ